MPSSDPEYRSAISSIGYWKRQARHAIEVDDDARIVLSICKLAHWEEKLTAIRATMSYWPTVRFQKLPKAITVTQWVPLPLTWD